MQSAEVGMTWIWEFWMWAKLRSTAWGLKTLTVCTARCVTPNQLPRKWLFYSFLELINKDLPLPCLSLQVVFSLRNYLEAPRANNNVQFLSNRQGLIGDSTRTRPSQVALDFFWFDGIYHRATCNMGRSRAKRIPDTPFEVASTDILLGRDDRGQEMRRRWHGSECIVRLKPKEPRHFCLVSEFLCFTHFANF